MRVRILTDKHLNTYKALQRDTRYADNEVSNHANTESWQRATCLSSNYQCGIRIEKLEALRDLIRKKDVHKANKYDDVHKNGYLCI